MLDFEIKHCSGIRLPGLRINFLGYVFVFYFCHRKPERTFQIMGHYFPVCSRCTGLVVGFFSAYLLRTLIIGNLWLSLLMIPMVLDGFSQELGDRTSNNFIRFFTGFFFTIGMLSVIWNVPIDIVFNLVGG